MIATVKFLSVPGISLSQSVYPVFSAGYEDYVEQTFWNTKVCKDLTQTITVPEFTDYDKCNMVAIGDELYYIDGYTRATNSANSVSFSVKYCAPPNLLTLNSTIDGVWERTPTRSNKIGEALGNSILVKENTYTFGKLPQTNVTDMLSHPYTGDTYWVEISLAGTLEQFRGNTGLTYKFTSGGVHRYGTFVYIDKTKLMQRANISIGGGMDGSMPYIKYSPALTSIISLDTSNQASPNPTNMFASTDVVGITISNKCPYLNKLSSSGAVHRTLYYMNGTTETEIEPSAVMKYYTLMSSRRYVCLYDLDQIDNQYADFNVEYAPEETYDLEVDVSDIDSLYDTKRITLYSDDNTMVCNIPPEAFTLNAGGTKYVCPIKYYTRSDNAGINTYITVNDVTYTIPGGHLPYVGTAWQDYISLSMNFDRQMTAMQNQQVRAETELQKQQEWVNSVTSIANTGAMVALGGVMAGFKKLATGATTAGAGGAGIITTALTNQFTDRNSDLSIQYNNEAQKLKEQNMKEQSASVYSSGYGLSYVIVSMDHGMRVEVWRMKDYTDAQIEKYHETFGYPGNGFATLTVGEGYYKGCIDRESISHTGIKGDNLVGMFANGFSIKKVDPVIL